MTPRTEQKLKELAGHFDLQIEYVNDLPDKVPGFLQPGPDPRYIFVNANKSRSDQAFTIAHELAHYVMHLDRPDNDFLPGYLKYPWKFKPLAEITRTTARFMRRKFNHEWQADLLAFIILWKIGAGDDLLAITKLYPQKTRMFWYSGAAAVYAGVKCRVSQLFFFYQ